MNETSYQSEKRLGLTGTVLAVFFILAIIGSSYWILLPFLPALVWATMIVISTWPFMLALQNRLKGRRALATAVMVLALLITLIVPLLLGVSTIVENTDNVRSGIQSLSNFEFPAPPLWLNDIPIIGTKLVKTWSLVSTTNKDDLIARITPYMGRLVTWFVAQIGNIGLLLIHFLLTLVLCAVLYLNGEAAADSVLSFAARLAGKRGEESARLAAKAIRAVALGVVGTALLQSIVAGLGYMIVGVPQAILLTAVTFLFSVIQIGAVPVMIPVVIWLFWSDMPGWAAFMIVCTVFVGVMDNVLRPLLIKRGANLPLLLIFAGVIGGLIAFGIIGLFVGPVVLAVSYTLLHAWIRDSSNNL